MLITACCYGAGRDSIDRRTVADLDLKSIMGTWYEIARFDHSFERGLEQVTATYTLQDDGTVEVKNRGILNGEERISVGHAKSTDEAGRLRVSFFWRFYSDYNVLSIAPNGEWMLIGRCPVHANPSCISSLSVCFSLVHCTTPGRICKYHAPFPSTKKHLQYSPFGLMI